MAKSVKSIFATAMVLVCVVAIVASRSYPQAQQPENFQRSFPLNPGGTLRVENYKGTIHVTGSTSNEVLVSVVKRFEGGSDSDRKGWMENVSRRQVRTGCPRHHQRRWRASGSAHRERLGTLEKRSGEL
jgi:hypothetical protein